MQTRASKRRRSKTERLRRNRFLPIVRTGKFTSETEHARARAHQKTTSSVAVPEDRQLRQGIGEKNYEYAGDRIEENADFAGEAGLEMDDYGGGENGGDDEDDERSTGRSEQRLCLPV